MLPESRILGKTLSKIGAQYGPSRTRNIKEKTMKVSPKTIQALALFVPKKDIREYLMNINFELQLNRTILTAANGHILLTICIDEPNEKEDTFMIPPGSFPKSDIRSTRTGQ